MLGALHVGPIPEGEALLQPLREYAEPLADFSGVTPYLEVQQLWDADYPRTACAITGSRSTCRSSATPPSTRWQRLRGRGHRRR